MKLLATTIILLSLLVLVSAQTEQAKNSSGNGTQVEVIQNGSRPSQKGPAENFTGSVRIDPLFQAQEPSRAAGASVTFEPGARTAWHTHPSSCETGPAPQFLASPSDSSRRSDTRAIFVRR